MLALKICRLWPKWEYVIRRINVPMHSSTPYALVCRWGLHSSTEVSSSAMKDALSGSHGDKKLAKNDKQYGKSLVPRCYARCIANDEGGQDAHTIKSARRKAL